MSEYKNISQKPCEGTYENAVEVRDLTVKYDGFTLDHVSFDVARGSIMGFIGQNGAGKTTTIKALLNIVRREEGSIRMLGLDNLAEEAAVKEQIAAVFDELPFPDRLSAKNLNAIMKEIYREWNSDTFLGIWIVWHFRAERKSVPSPRA